MTLMIVLGRRTETDRLDDPHHLRTLRPLADLADQLGLLADLLKAGAVQHGNVQEGVRRPVDR